MNRENQMSHNHQKERINFDFFNASGELNLNWLDEKAKKFAEEKIGSIRTSQIRAFYNDFLTYKAMPFIDEDFERKVVPLLKLMKAKVTNRQNRGKLLDKDGYFLKFIYNLVDVIDSKQKLDDVCLIFEAVVGYFPNPNKE